MRIASISVYGGLRGDGKGGPRPVWNEARFLETLQSQASPELARVAQELYGFMQGNSDSVVWGTGTTQGSVGFGVRCGGDRFTLFGVTTKGQIYLGTGALNRSVPREVRASLPATLRSFGVDASDELLDIDFWLTFDADRLREPDALERFKSAVLQVRESLGKHD